MGMKADKITTIVGAVGAGVVAAEPILNSVAGSLHSSDYFNVIGAALIAIFGYFTNKR